MKIIAEIGFNHGGDMDMAKTMIQEASKSGAHVVKFQTFKSSDIVLPSSPHADLIKAGELDLEQHRLLFEEATRNNVDFMSTPFGLKCVEILEDIGVGIYKIASMDVTNIPLLNAVARTGKPVILSTGMAVLSEIAAAVDALLSNGATEISLLHCISQYPAQESELNLAAIGALKDIFNLPVGYSDHFPGTKACLAAYLHGADIIETHFTLDTTIPDGDHSHSADPKMLRQLVEDITLFKTMSGNAQEFFNNRPDRENAKLFRRGIHSARDLQEGDLLGMEDLLLCRPEQGLQPAALESVVGMRITESIPAHAPIQWSHFKPGGKK